MIQTLRACMLLCLLTMMPLWAQAMTQPNPTLTPGVLCTASDPNFSGYAYAEHIAKCNRNVDDQEKNDIAHAYGNIPQADWVKYEFDHLIPLCVRGSVDIKNVWPQVLSEAHEKDKLENEICIGMQTGKMTQAEAIQKVRDWFQSRTA